MPSEKELKSDWMNLKAERGRIGPMSVYNGVLAVMNLAELNAYQTDYDQNKVMIDEEFWGTVMGSLIDILGQKKTTLEVKNWFALQGIWA